MVPSFGPSTSRSRKQIADANFELYATAALERFDKSYFANNAPCFFFQLNIAPTRHEKKMTWISMYHGKSGTVDHGCWGEALSYWEACTERLVQVRSHQRCACCAFTASAGPDAT